MGNEWEEGNTRWQEQTRIKPGTTPKAAPEYLELRREIERLSDIVDRLEKLEAERGDKDDAIDPDC